jgi:hypothetical protein
MSTSSGTARIELEQVAQHRPAIKLAEGAADAEHDADAEGADRDQDGIEQAAQEIAAPAGRAQGEQVEDVRLRQLKDDRFDRSVPAMRGDAPLRDLFAGSPLDRMTLAAPNLARPAVGLHHSP